MNTISNFRRVMLFDRAGTKNPVLPLFFSEERSLKVKDVEDVKDYEERVISDMTEVAFNATVLSNGAGGYVPLIPLLAFYKDGGVSAEFLGEVKNGVHDGVLKFVGSNCLGLNFEYGWSALKRFYTVSLLRRFPERIYESIISNAVTDDYIHFGNTPPLYEPGSNVMDQRSFQEFISFSWGSTPALFTGEEIVDLSFGLKSDSGENYLKKSIPRRILIELSVTLDKASITDLKAFGDGNDKRTNGISPAINYKVAYSDAGKTEEHKFAAGVLTRTKEIDWNHTTRFLKLKFTGSVNPHLITSSVVADNFTFNYTK
ncbi:MAG: hypothetical protein LC102_09050 [Ignavibacteriales bacterium]|nr:hypothetical protein [Ignavibacteriaceae bacterium]MBZ0197241.1 hypothetical protein [Ignavibacteriaceae bacterium]MCZ2143561.1 hypothetical protein [Ignavibacteriales bacterium]WKZ72117.1 MAG: hypothetical protein QY308_10860 [Ignavibacteriaceae bacterium]